MKTKLYASLVSAIGAVAIVMSAGSARALTYTLATGNSAISGYSGPYGTVDVNLTDSTHATITFTSTVVNGNINLFGDGGTVGVNVNATSWTIGSFSASNAGTGFTPGPLSSGGSGNEDGFGVFNQKIDSFDGYTHSSDTVSFVLTDTSGTWASAANVLVANADGNTVAAHIFITSSPANASNGALVTGFATDSGSTTVPDGGTTAALLGFVFVGLAVVRAKFARN